MPEVTDNPKMSFTQRLATERPKDEAEHRAMQAGAIKQPPVDPPATKPEPAPQKPPEAKPAPAQAITDPDQEILDGKRSPKNDDFKRVKHAATEASKERDALKTKTGEYERELGEIRKSPKHNSELIKQIESERDELKAKWQTVAAQFDSGFHAKYEARIGEAIAKIKDAVPADKLDKIAQLIQMPDSQWKRQAMAELTEEMDAPTITDIMIANREVRDILASRRKELDDSGAILKSSAEQRQKEQAERKSAYAKAFDAVLDNKSKGDKALPVLQTREGDTPEVKAWNDGVAERSRIAKSIFMGELETPEERAEAAIWAASAPGFLQELKMARSENDTLKETLAKLQSSSPGMGSSGKADTGGKKMSFTERAMAEAMP